jgi:hypothetical protein
LLSQELEEKVKQPEVENRPPNDGEDDLVNGKTKDCEEDKEEQFSSEEKENEHSLNDLSSLSTSVDSIVTVLGDSDQPVVNGFAAPNSTGEDTITIVKSFS